MYALLLASLLCTSTVTASHSNAVTEELRGLINSALICPEGARLRACSWEKEPEIIALYFGANWCVPCHAFTPKLRQIRQSFLDAGVNTEVVYVSQDSSEADMRRYMRQSNMPWPGISPRRLRTLPAIHALAGAAPPNLVLIDRNGQVIASGWEGRRYLGLQSVLQVWLDYFMLSSFDHAP